MKDQQLPKVDTSQMIESVCEFCKLKFWIDVRTYSLVHEIPYCPEFAAMDVIDFMVKNREIKESKRVTA